MAILSGGKMQATSEIMENSNVRKYINIGFKKGDKKDGINYLEISNIRPVYSKSTEKISFGKYYYHYSAILNLTGDEIFFILDNPGEKNEKIKLISSSRRMLFEKHEGEELRNLYIPDYLQNRDCTVWWDLCDASDQSSISEETGSAISTALENIAVILQEISGKLSTPSIVDPTAPNTETI